MILWKGTKEGSGFLRKILILEKDADTLISLKSMIEERAEIYALSDAQKAYKCAVKNFIDLFIVDTTLEEEGGEMPPELAFVDKIRDMERYYSTPVLFITDFQTSKLYTYEKLNCYKMVGKPVQADQFKRVVEDSLRALRYNGNLNQVFFRRFGVVHWVLEEEIVYITVKTHKVFVHLRDERVLCLPYMPVQQVREKLKGDNFIQCKRDTIVNRDYIQNVDLTRHKILLTKDYGEIEVGVTYSQYLEELYSQDW